MDFILVTDVLKETISQIENQMPTKDVPLVKRFQRFLELIQQKILENGTPEKDFTQTLDSMLEKKKLLKDKLKTLQDHAKKELDFKSEIIARNNSLIVERKKHYEEILVAERAMYQQQITLTKNAFQIREEREYRTKMEQIQKRLAENRTMNVAIERTRRREWTQKKDVLQEIVDEYDTRMTAQQEKLEYLTALHEHEKCELERYKILCEEQERPYHDLMCEKEEYLESVRQQKLHEIRVKIAERTIVKFIEQYYPIWKKKKLKATKKKSKYRSRYGK